MKILICVLMTINLALAFEQGDRSEFVRSRGNVREWSQNKMATLARAFDRAQASYQYGKKEQAVQELKQGLLDAVDEIQSDYYGALTSKAIMRGLNYISAIKSQTRGDRLQTKTLAFFLFEYYEFINNVNTHLDIPFYTPGDCRFCFFGKHKKFERKLIKFSKMQVNMILSRLTEVTYEYGNPVTYPVGSPKALLKSLELATTYMADDLSDSTRASRFACVIDELDYLSDRLSEYNTLKTGYPNEFYAVQESTAFARDITGGNTNCGSNVGDRVHDRSSRRQSTTFQANTRRFKVKSTEPVVSLRLNERVRIKKLIISAEGIRRDAMFDVVVNGDVKGTIYVPGRDPSYIVTVNEAADSIEFMPRNGNARIFKVLVVTESGVMY